MKFFLGFSISNEILSNPETMKGLYIYLVIVFSQHYGQRTEVKE